MTHSPSQAIKFANPKVAKSKCKEGFFSLIAPIYSPCEPQSTESLFEISSLSWCQFPDVWYPGWMSDGPGGDNLPHWPLYKNICNILFLVNSIWLKRNRYAINMCHSLFIYRHRGVIKKPRIRKTLFIWLPSKRGLKKKT